ncbi:MAG: histidine kinase, partial [Oscillospiraceae bacterium]
EAKVAQNNAELIGYRSQINPHFLFNTLECMRSMAHIYRAEPIEHIVSSMAKMFRYSLYSPMQVTLEDELRHVESYVGVMNQRFLDKFHLKIQVPPETRRCTLVSMILQPIVENAILHGFPAKQKYCCISISATGSGDNWVIRMTDNGRGISKEKCREINEDLRLKKDDPHEEKSSISLRNIYRRMTLVTGGNFLMELRSRESFYTQVECRFGMKR